MKKRLIHILLLIFALILSVSICAQDDKKVKTILIFFTFNSNIPAYQDFLEGFKQHMQEDYQHPVNILVEYLDMERFQNGEMAQAIVNLYNETYLGKRIDLIITMAPGSFDLLKKYKLKILNEVPVLSVESRDLSDKLIPDQYEGRTKVINLTFDFTSSLQNIVRIFPNRKNIFIIGGDAKIDHYFMKIILKAAQSIDSSIHFKPISGISIDSVLRIVSHVPSDAIIMISSFLKDSYNTAFSTSQVIDMVSNAANVPVATFTDNFLNKGAIGGFVMSYYNVGVETMRVTGEILNKKDPDQIVVNTSHFYQHMYDEKVLKKWGLSKSELIPEESIIINKEFDFIATYKWYLIALAGFIILQTFLIINFVKLYRDQKKLAIQKGENEKLFRYLVREDRMMIMSELTAALSHELNQPLTAILFNAQSGHQLADSDKLDKSLAKEIFSRIADDDKRAGSIISSIRNLMKLEERNKEKLELVSVLSETLDIFKPEANNRNISIYFETDKKAYDIFGDKIQIQQVLLNLLNNSAHAMEELETLDKIIEIKVRSEGQNVLTFVEDNGPGISNEMLSNLFKPFESKHKEGLGIGLSLCKNIIENHDGELFAENIPEGGARFYFRLKIQKQ